MADLLPALIPIVSRCRQDVTWKKVGSHVHFERKAPISKLLLREHLRGIRMRGMCPINECETTTRIAVLDLDSHDGETPWESMQFVAANICEKFEELNYFPVAFRSTGGHGVHIYLVWDTPQDAYSVREFLEGFLAKLGFNVGTKGIAAGEIEVFPKQDKIEKGAAGSMFVLPLAGESVPLDPLFGYAPGKKEDALFIEWKDSLPVPVLEPKVSAPSKKKTKKGVANPELRKMLDTIPSETNYDLWIKIGMALHAETEGSDEGLSLWEDWSSRCKDYAGFENLKYKWDSFRNDKNKLITINSVKKIASEKGWQEDYSQDFEDITEQPMTDEEKAASTGRFRPIPADTYLKRPRAEWIIKGILPRGKLGMTYGGSGDGKTFAILDMACAIALGIPWQGRKTKQGNVIYICAEGAGGFVSRLEAYAQEYKISKKELGEHLKIIPAAPNFLGKKDFQELLIEINLANDKTDLVIVDTLAQTTTGADENSAKDMNIALKHIEQLSEATHATCHLIHHAGKDETRGARGTSALKAPLDVQFHVSKDGERRVFWVEKLKDGKDGFGWNFTLKTVDIGIDEDGDLERSCVVQFDDAKITTKKSIKNKFGETSRKLDRN